jgi:hypothetical protein
MHNWEIDRWYVERCLVFSVSTLLAMPQDRMTTKLAQGRQEILREVIEGYGWHELHNRRSTPGSQAISDMDEIATWLRFIPQTPVRKIVALRCTVHPVSGRPISFDKIGKRLVPTDPIDGKSIQRWYIQGLEAIAKKLKDGNAKRLPVLPEAHCAEILDERVF